ALPIWTELGAWPGGGGPEQFGDRDEHQLRNEPRFVDATGRRRTADFDGDGLHGREEHGGERSNSILGGAIDRTAWPARARQVVHRERLGPPRSREGATHSHRATGD